MSVPSLSVDTFDDTFNALDIKRETDWAELGGRCGVGAQDDAKLIEPVWSDKQLELGTPSAPRTRRDGEARFVDQAAVHVSRSQFTHLLDEKKRAEVEVVAIADALIRPATKGKVSKRATIPGVTVAPGVVVPSQVPIATTA